MTEGTLQAIVIARPEPTAEVPQNLCLDKGFDYDEVRVVLAAWGCTTHLRTRGEETQAKKHVPGYRARRWAVERIHPWLNRFRLLLARWEKKVETYLAIAAFCLRLDHIPCRGTFRIVSKN